MKEVTYVRFSRRTRGSSYCCSFFLIPALAALLVFLFRLGSFLMFLSEPGKYKNPLLDFDKLAMGLLLSVMLSIILVMLVLPPKRIDKLIDWWFGL